MRIAGVDAGDYSQLRLSNNLVLSVSQPQLYGYIQNAALHIAQPGELRWVVRQPQSVFDRIVPSKDNQKINFLRMD